MEKLKIGRRFEGKVAIVTASTQGIGFAIAQRLGLEAASVVISSRKQKNIDEATQKLKAQGIEIFGLVCHVANAQHRKNLIERTLQKYRKIDVIICNAAVNPSAGTILEIQESVIDKLWEVNIKSSILLLKDAVPHMQNGSSIVFISSIAGYLPQPSMGMYGVTKTALLGLTKALALEMAPNIRVNCVAPGFVPTLFAKAVTSNDVLREAVEKMTLLNKFGTTQDMASWHLMMALTSLEKPWLWLEACLLDSSLPFVLFI